MSAEVVPFPRSSNRPFVARQAAYAAGLRPEKAAAHLRRQLDLQREIMTRRGIAPERIAVELDRLEIALVSAMRRMASAPSEGAAS